MEDIIVKNYKRELSKVQDIRIHKILYTLIVLIQDINYAVLALVLGKVISDVSNNNLNNNFLYLLIPFILLAIVLGIVFPWYSRYVHGIANKRLVKYTINKLMDKPLVFFKDANVGETINYLDMATECCSYYLVRVIPELINSFFTFVVIFGIIFYYNYILALVAIVLFFLVGYIYNPISKKFGEAQADVYQNKSINYNNISEIVNNIETVKSIKLEKYLSEKYTKDYNEKYLPKDYNFAKKYGIYLAVDGVITYILPLLVLILGVVISSFGLIEVGLIITIYNLVGRLPDKISMVFQLVADKLEFKELILKIDDILKVETTNKEMVNDFKSLEFKSKGISFDKKTILEDINFNLLPNDFISIVGESGKGKSTIFKYLLGIEENDNIKVTVDNKNISNLDLSKLILMVNQKPLLFKDTLINNILCGSNFKEEEIKEVIDTCLLSEFVKNYGYDKLFDNLDSNISGGEKQRVALARILIRKPKILLLDEITASLDEKSSNDLALNIYNYTRKYNISVAVISHKDEFTKYANKIVNL